MTDDRTVDDPTATPFAIHPDWAAGGGWLEAADAADPNDDLFAREIEPADLDTADEFAAVLVGEPYDGAVLGRPGASDGPPAIRRSLASVKTHHFDGGPVRSVGDLGDVRTLVEHLESAGDDSNDAASVVRLQENVAETTAAIHGLEALPVFLGGDNSVTYANVAPLCRGDASVGVVNLDAHLDVREVREAPTSGTPYRQLFAEGLERYACVGARHFETSTAYHEYVRERDGEIVTAEEVGDGVVDAADRALEAMADVDRVYVSVDCDVLDASAAPGVSAPTPGGLRTRELYRLLRLLASDDRIAGFEVVECAPPPDRDGLTADAAARAVAHFLAGYSEGRR